MPVSTNLQADQVLQLFKNSAVQIPGDEVQAGDGLINAGLALKQIAAQTAVLTSLTVGEGELSIEDVDVTLTGKYFPVPVDNGGSGEPEVPLVKFGEGEGQVQLAVKSFSDTEIIVTVPPFTGNPNVIVNTNSENLGFPASAGGGDSNPLPIFNDGRIALKITANNVDIEYGQSYESQFDVVVEGLPEGVTLADLGLPNIKFSTPAVGSYPDVNNYALVPSFAAPLSEEQAAAYQVNFVNGLFTVTKKDLTISPEDLNITYGDAVELQLNYQYATVGITDNTLFLQTIKNAHAADFYADNTLALINRAKALVNNEFLDGGSWMATENTILNRAKALVNDMHVIDLDVQVFENYLVNRAKALVNGETNLFSAIVNGEDLLAGNVTFNNRAKALVNDSGLGGADDKNNYESVFTILDLLDDSEEGGSVDKFYSLNLLSGLDVTNGDEDLEYSYPGTFLSPTAANFNITYASGKIRVAPATLHIQTPNITQEYGDRITAEDINSIISGYKYEETATDIFSEGIPYYFVDIATNQDYELGEQLNVGRYEIRVHAPLNYSLNYDVVGILEIAKKSLTAKTDALEIPYGQLLSVGDINLNVSGFAEGEDESVFAEEFGDIPYYLVDAQNNQYELGQPLNVGQYEIRLREPKNYVVANEVGSGKLTVVPAILTIQIGDLLVNQGTVPDPESIPVEFLGFVYYDTAETIFPQGIPYYFEDAQGNELVIGKLGKYAIKIRDAQNYIINLATIGTLYINPYGVGTVNVHARLKCVEYDRSSLQYIANFKYENNNTGTVYVFQGADNQLTSEGTFVGEAPFEYAPGKGYFSIHFDGAKLIWSLTTNDGVARKTETVTATSRSNDCRDDDDHEDDDHHEGEDDHDRAHELHGSYGVVYPNPVKDILKIALDEPQDCTIKIYDYYGRLKFKKVFTASNTQPIEVNMGSYRKGMYILKIITAQGHDDYSILKDD